MSSMLKLNLRKVVRDTLAESTLADPKELADYIVADVLDEDDYEDALRIALPQYVAQIMRQERGRTIAAIGTPTTPRSNGTKKNGKANRGRKTVARDESGVLAERIYNGSQWILLGDATADDVATVIADYERRAAESSAGAKRFGKLAKVFKRHNTANTVSDLPIGEVEKALI